MPIPRSIERFLTEQHVPYSVIPHRPAYTAQEEAALADVPGWQWAKTVACVVDDRSSQSCRPNHSSTLTACARLPVPAPFVSHARPTSAILPADCEVGAMPPGPLYGQPVFIDRALAGAGDIVFDGGSHRDAVKNEVRRLRTCRAAHRS